MEPETLYGLFDAEPDARAGGAEGLYGGDPVRPRYNIAPTITVPVVRLEPKVAPGDAARQIEPMRWGLVPSWADDPGIGERLAEQVAAAVHALRAQELLKPPGVAETLDWARALRELDRDELDAQTAAATLGAVLKYREDHERVVRAGLDRLLAP